MGHLARLQSFLEPLQIRQFDLISSNISKADFGLQPTNLEKSFFLLIS
jgi:hypothetical protein